MNRVPSISRTSVHRARAAAAALACAALLSACGTPNPHTLDDTGEIAHDADTRAAADDTIADALGTRLSVLGPICNRAAAELDGEVEWAGLHCTIAAERRWAVGMIDEGADPDPFRRTRHTLDDEVAVAALGDEAWFDPDDTTLYVSDEGQAFFVTVLDGTPADRDALESLARAAVLHEAPRRS